MTFIKIKARRWAETSAGEMAKGFFDTLINVANICSVSRSATHEGLWEISTVSDTYVTNEKVEDALERAGVELHTPPP